MNRLRIVVNGANGRMGQTVIACAASDLDVEIVAAVNVDDDLGKALQSADTIIDFSHHSATGGVVTECVTQRKSAVIGTTGHSEDERHAVRDAARTVPIVMSPNFSVGVNTLFWLVRKTAETLGTEFDLEVVEMHHRLKQDAPSGTARRLAEILAEVRTLNYNEHARHGREGMTGVRTSDEIGVHAIRGGDVVGDHTVIFAGQGERLELTHKASTRETFARGAIRAAKWLRDQRPGLYSMQDVLGF
jgi:4-hydroxy-tetrahydrodipicolinate reductase